MIERSLSRSLEKAKIENSQNEKKRSITLRFFGFHRLPISYSPFPKNNNGPEPRWLTGLGGGASTITLKHRRGGEVKRCVVQMVEVIGEDRKRIDRGDFTHLLA